MKPRLRATLPESMMNAVLYGVDGYAGRHRNRRRGGGGAKNRVWYQATSRCN